MKGTDDEANALDGKVQAIIGENLSFCEESSGYGHCEIFDWKNFRKDFGYLPLDWKFEQKFRHTSRSNLFCERKRVWNGANQKVDLV